MIRTVGHGTLGAEELAGLLVGAGIDMVVDVRRYPASRRHPDVARVEMERWLGECQVAYRWLPALGGRRTASATSPNVGLRSAQFRGYADHMGSDEFAAGVVDLRLAADGRSVAIMCAESLWWHCHRRLLADHLVLVDNCAVEHLFHDGRLSRHPPTAEARRVGRQLIYDVGVQTSLLDES